MILTTDIFSILQSKIRNIYRGSPNFEALVRAISVPIQDRVNVYEYILSMRTIDEKVGVFLDQVGSKIGVKRPPAQVDERFLFTLYDEDEAGENFDEYTGFSEEDEPELGGYLIDENGLDTGDGELMSDADYRVLLKQKAALIRSKMTEENLIEYFLVFGCPIAIDDSNNLVVHITPNNDADLSQWERWYIENHGFKPAGIRVEMDTTVGASLL